MQCADHVDVVIIPLDIGLDGVSSHSLWPLLFWDPAQTTSLYANWPARAPGMRLSAPWFWPASGGCCDKKGHFYISRLRRRNLFSGGLWKCMKELLGTHMCSYRLTSLSAIVRSDGAPFMMPWWGFSGFSHLTIALCICHHWLVSVQLMSWLIASLRYCPSTVRLWRRFGKWSCRWLPCKAMYRFVWLRVSVVLSMFHSSRHLICAKGIHASVWPLFLRPTDLQKRLKDSTNMTPTIIMSFVFFVLTFFCRRMHHKDRYQSINREIWTKMPAHLAVLRVCGCRCGQFHNKNNQTRNNHPQQKHKTNTTVRSVLLFLGMANTLTATFFTLLLGNPRQFNKESSNCLRVLRPATDSILVGGSSDLHSLLIPGPFDISTATTCWLARIVHWFAESAKGWQRPWWPYPWAHRH